MDGLTFYLYGFPLLLASALVSLFLTVYRDKGLPEAHWRGLAYLANYSLANVLFVWTWSSVSQWRQGLLVISTVLILSLTMAQLVSAIRIRKTGIQTWLAWPLLGAFVFLNLPIILISFFRAAFSN